MQQLLLLMVNAISIQIIVDFSDFIFLLHNILFIQVSPNDSLCCFNISPTTSQLATHSCPVNSPENITS